MMAVEYGKRLKQLEKNISFREVKLEELERNIFSKEEKLETVESRLKRMVKKQKVQSKKFFVEKCFNGVRAFIHNKNGTVKIFSEDGGDLTALFPDVASQAPQLADASYILDCEIVFHNEKIPFGKLTTIKFLEDDTVNFNVKRLDATFYAVDCLYFGKSLMVSPLYERKRFLASMSFTQNIRESGAILIDNPSDAKQAIMMCEKMPESIGAIVKDGNSQYEMSDSSLLWGLYKPLASVNAIVVEQILLQETASSKYSLGIFVPKSIARTIDKACLSAFDGKILMKFFPEIVSSSNHPIGETVEVRLSKLDKHLMDDGTFYYEASGAVINNNSKPASLSTIKQFDEIVLKYGNEITYGGGNPDANHNN